MKLSIVTTLYQSEKFIDEFCNRACTAAQQITDSYEVILVDDGSSDDSAKKAKRLCLANEKITLIQLSRNFGHHRAIMTGLKHAKGEYVFLINSDLEEAPEILNSFWHELQEEENLDVIYGIQKKRPGSFFSRSMSALFIKVFNILSENILPQGVNLTRLMKQTYVKELCRYQEKELVFAGVAKLAGFNQKPSLIERKYKGSSHYNFKQKAKLGINYITSFSSKPLELIFYVGLLFTLISWLSFIYVLAQKLLFNEVLQGWTSIMLSVWMLGSILILFLGIIGIYLSKIFLEVKERPYTIVKEIFTKNTKPQQEES